MASGSESLLWKALVIFPHNKEKAGMEAPTPMAAMDPHIIRILSVLSANLNILK